MSTLHNFTFYIVKNGVRFATAFSVFTKIKGLLMYTEFVRRYDEKIITIKTFANWFKQFKNCDFDINENAPDVLQL